MVGSVIWAIVHRRCLSLSRRRSVSVLTSCCALNVVLVPQGGWGEIPMYYDVCECDPGRQCERTEFVDQCEVFGCLRTGARW